MKVGDVFRHTEDISTFLVYLWAHIMAMIITFVSYDAGAKFYFPTSMLLAYRFHQFSTQMKQYLIS